MFQKLRRAYKNLMITNYYINKRTGKNRSVMSRFTDLVAIVVVATLVLTIVFSFFFSNLLHISIGSLALSAVLSLFSVKLSHLKAEKLRQDNRLKLSQGILWEKISQKESIDYYIDIKKLFTTMEHFDNVGMEKEDIIRCTYRGKDTIIKVNKNPDNLLVDSEEIKGFAELMLHLKCEKGIFVTTSKFTNAALEQCGCSSNNIVAVDKDKLLYLLESSGFGTAKDKIDELEDTEIFSQNKISRKELSSIVFSVTKIRTYLLLSAFLFIAGAVMEKSVYYQVGGVVLAVLGFSSYGIHVFNNRQNTISSKIDFFD